MPIDTRDWYRERYGYRPPDSHRSYRPPRRKLPLGKIFLILLIVACVVATIYTGYLLLTHRTNWSVGAIVLAADIGVLIWNISVLRKYRVGAGTVISILVVITLLGAIVSAFAGVEPFSDAKAEVVGWFQKVGSQTPTPRSSPASEYPADISGRVTIAEKVKCLTAIAVPPSRDSDVFWIVDITVKNNAYSDSVVASFQDCYKGWVIIANDETFRPVACGSYTEPMSLALGETGQFMIYFSMPETLHISDAQICYQGREPYSYGKLTGGDRVVAYDWDSKKVITEPKAVVVADNWEIQLDGKSWKGSTVTVKLTITNLGPRRNFGMMASFLYPGPELVAIDSTEKAVEPWVPTPSIDEMREGILFYVPPYTREFYPNESWSGSLKFEMSPYSGETKLYIRFYQRPYFLFDLGSPTKD